MALPDFPVGTRVYYFSFDDQTKVYGEVTNIENNLVWGYWAERHSPTTIRRNHTRFCYRENVYADGIREPKEITVWIVMRDNLPVPQLTEPDPESEVIAIKQVRL